MTWRARKWVSLALSRHAGVKRTDGQTNDKEGMFAAQGGAAEGRCGRKIGGEEGLHKGRSSGGTINVELKGIEEVKFKDGE